MLSISETLASRFFNEFEIINADNEVLQQRIYRVRHRVFCQELGFAMQTNGGFEKNEYDDHSLHILLRERATNTDIACVRVVEPLKRGGGLPFESFGLRYIDRKLFDWKRIDSRQCCEFSRLAAMTSVRRPSGGEVDAPKTGEKGIAKDLRALIPMALSYAAFSVSLARDYQWIFMGAEPRLQRLIARFGINCLQISPLFEYYGQRALFVLGRDQLLADMRSWKPEWLELYNRISYQLTRSKEEVAIALAS